jgi:ABC-type sugar transport system permease subunit
MLRTKRLTPYLFIAPMWLLLLFVFAYPLVQIFNFSFRRIRGATGPFIGLGNYEQIFTDNIYKLSVQHNAILLLAVPIMVIIAILVAVLLYERVAGWRVHRFILFAPYVIAVPVIGHIFSNLLSLNGGINEALRAVGLGLLALDWLGSPGLALWTLMGVVVWRQVGFGITLFLARLLSLNEELLEAGTIDGANWWQRLWYIIVPELMTVIEFYVVVSTIEMLAWIFPFVWVMTHGGPSNATEVMELYIWKYAFKIQLPGVASAVAVILFLITLALIIPLFFFQSRQRETEATA